MLNYVEFHRNKTHILNQLTLTVDCLAVVQLMEIDLFFTGLLPIYHHFKLGESLILTHNAALS
jgi:hypothetical protein